LKLLLNSGFTGTKQTWNLDDSAFSRPAGNARANLLFSLFGADAEPTDPNTFKLSRFAASFVGMYDSPFRFYCRTLGISLARFASARKLS
jgi:hypothetical protein